METMYLRRGAKIMEYRLPILLRKRNLIIKYGILSQRGKVSTYKFPFVLYILHYENDDIFDFYKAF